MWGFFDWLLSYLYGGGDFTGNSSLHHGERGRFGRVRDRWYHR